MVIVRPGRVRRLKGLSTKLGVPSKDIKPPLLNRTSNNFRKLLTNNYTQSRTQRGRAGTK